MAEIYPATLPDPQQDGYSRDRQSGLISSNPQSGPLLSRRVSFDNPSTYTLRWQMTQSEAILFDLWWREQLDEGLKPFTITLLNESGLEQQVEVKFLPDEKPRLDRTQYKTFFYSAAIYVRKVVQEYDGEYATISELAEISPNGDWMQGANLLDIIVNKILPEG